MKFKLSLLSVALLLNGCMSLNPEISRNENVIPKQLPNKGIYENNTHAEFNSSKLDWKNYIKDEKLKTVVQLALDNNKDLKIALANIESAKAQYNISTTELLPMVNGNISGNKTKSQNSYSESYQAGVGFSSFEIDAFGRVKSLNDAALSNFLATQEAQKVANLSIISETAKAYFAIAIAQSNLEIAKKTQESSSKSLELIKKRVEHGISTAKDESDSSSIFYLAQADVLNYQTKIEQGINALNVLVGSTLDITLLPTNIEDLKSSIADINIPLESDMLYNRPDVLAAEYQLLAANANIGAARASFFPRITLTTSLGIASQDLSNLFTDNFKTWSFIPTISIPIFDVAKNNANLKYTKAQKDKMLATYEKTIQQAFRETADTLARKSTINSQLETFHKHVGANQTSYDLATKMFDAGVKDYLSVLTAQTNLYNAQRNLLNLEQERFNNLIDLYKVIGN